MKVHNRIQLLKWSGIINFLYAYIKPNSITLAGSELVRSWFEAGSCQIPLLAGSRRMSPNRFGASSYRPTSSEPAPNKLA